MFSPEDCRLLMELDFIKLLDLDPIPGSGFTKKDGSESGSVTLDSQHWSEILKAFPCFC
jgi:hypothetical protein